MFNRCKIYEKTYWWSFAELVQYCLQDDEAPFNTQWNQTQIEAVYKHIPAVIYRDYDYGASENPSYHLKPYLSDLFQSIYGRYWQEYIFETKDNQSGSDEWNEKYVEFATKIGYIINSTYDRYAKLLSIYQDEYNKLLDGVKSTTTGVGRFNDTPQNITDGDEFGDNTHVSNITKSTAEAVSDVDTKINRIDEIQRKFRNLLKDWTDEFDGLFIERGNI